jgi:ubiquitin-conjugating enzyme E2 R
MSGEEAGERWSPAQRAETVLLSIISLLDDAEISSPANVDASVQFRDHRDEFKIRVLQDVDASKKDIPEGFQMPTHESTKPVIEEKPVDDNFWQDSDAEELDLDDDFDFDDDAANGSESDEALNNSSEDDDDFEETETINKASATPTAKSKGKSKAKDDAEMTDAE